MYISKIINPLDINPQIGVFQPQAAESILVVKDSPNTRAISIFLKKRIILVFQLIKYKALLRKEVEKVRTALPTTNQSVLQRMNWKRKYLIGFENIPQLKIINN